MKAKGWFFVAVETFLCPPRGLLFGQGKADSCVAACARMLLGDAGIEEPEAFIRAALGLQDGAFLSQLPGVLSEFGLSIPYQYRRDLSVSDLRRAVTTAPAPVFVVQPGQLAGHALIVDDLDEQHVVVRDPLPEGEGRAYRLALADFLSHWLDPKTGFGRAVVVLD